MRFVVMNRDASRSWTADVIARERLQRIQRRFVVGAFDADGDALSG
jgi:hypothetical protein